MSGHVEVVGKVVDSCKGTLVVRDDHGNEIKAKLSGKMKLNKIMVLVGDRVMVKVSPYDLTNGFIVSRLTNSNRQFEIIDDEWFVALLLLMLVILPTIAIGGYLDGKSKNPERKQGIHG